MHTSKTNGNASARTLRVERGVSLGHRQLNAHQRAVIAADILDGLAIYQPTAQELSRTLKVSVPYIAHARKLPPEQRRVVLRYPGMRNPAISRRNADAELFDSIAHAGVDRVLSIAARVDQAQRAQH